MAASWTALLRCVALLLLVLVLRAGAADAAVMRGPPSGRGQGPAEEADPLALLVLRAVGPGGDASPAAVGEGTALVGVDAAAAADDLAALMEAAAPPRAPAAFRPSDGAVGGLSDKVLLRAVKRQVRYHQCYFNPISCFG